MLNMKSARELKLRNFVKEKLSLYSGRVSTLSSRNQSNNKHTKTTKIIKHSSNNNTTNSKSNSKNLSRAKSPLRSFLLKTEQRAHKSLYRYNPTQDTYNIKVINDIIYDEKKHIVSLFRNFLLWDETSDFLKRFYYKIESVDRLPRITGYYEKYTMFPPVYFALEDVVHIMGKFVKKKKRYLEKIEENEDNVEETHKKKEIKDFNCIINPKEINETNTFLTNVDNNNTLMNSIGGINMLLGHEFTNEDNTFTESNINNNESRTLIEFDITKEMNSNADIKNYKKIEIKKLDFTKLNNKQNDIKNNTERVKLNLPTSTKSSSKPKNVYTTHVSKKKPKTNLVIPQKTLVNHMNSQPIKFNSIENLLRIVRYPNRSNQSSRISSSSKAKLKKKTKTNLVINTNRDSSKINKKNSISHSKQKKKLNVINTNPNTNINIAPSSIYNINLNLNLGHTTRVKTSINNSNSTNNKKSNSTTANKISHNTSNSNSNQNLNHKHHNIPSIVRAAFVPKTKINMKTSYTKASKTKGKIKEKSLYDLNLNNVHISIRKQPSANVNTSNTQGVNININCGHKMSRNDNKINGTVTHSTQTNRGKHRVIPIKEKNVYHDNSVSLHKVKKKIKIDKKYPLTSRNEKESIPYELIRKIIKKI